MWTVWSHRSRQEKGPGKLHPPPGLSDTWKGRLRVIPTCFGFRPDGCVARDRTQRQTRTHRHIRTVWPHANNSCEPDALHICSFAHWRIHFYTCCHTSFSKCLILIDVRAVKKSTVDSFFYVMVTQTFGVETDHAPASEHYEWQKEKVMKEALCPSK